MSSLVEIDGSVLEGGGQILRMSIALSALCGIPIKISKIRAGRSKPGLAAQHLNGLRLVRDLSNGRLRGDEIGSTEVEFIPGKIKGGRFEADTKTAGSISLLLQVALPCALYADNPVELHLKGGTNADMAPQIDYMTEVFRPNFERFGGSFDFDLYKRGYFPKGGGHVSINVKPVKLLSAVNLTEVGSVKCIHGWSFVAGRLPMAMSYGMADGAKNVLKQNYRSISPDIQCYKENESMARDNANGIILVCETTSGCIIGGSGLGKRGVEPNAVGVSAATEIIEALSQNSCVDQHMQDQIILFMALAEGMSSVRIGKLTLHTTTAIHIAEKLINVKFNIKEENGGNIITCTGIGLNNKSTI